MCINTTVSQSRQQIWERTGSRPRAALACSTGTKAESMSRAHDLSPPGVQVLSDTAANSWVIEPEYAAGG